MVHVGHDFIAPYARPTCTRDAPTNGAQPDGDARRASGCCPGVVRGPCGSSPTRAKRPLAAGEILVAERTDPGWIMLFPAAAGLLVERGSLLSHSAIVAREMGIPAVVAIAGVTRWLETATRWSWTAAPAMCGASSVCRTPHERIACVCKRTPSRHTGSEVAAQADFSATSATPSAGRTPTSSSRGSTCRPGDVCLSIASAGDNALALLARPGPRRRPGPQPGAARVPRAARRRVPRAGAPGAAGADRLDAERPARRAVPRAAGRASSRRPRLLGRQAAPRSSAASARPESSSATSPSSAAASCRWSTAAPTVEQLLCRAGPTSGCRFYERDWNTWRWRLLFRVFFSPIRHGPTGPRPELLPLRRGQRRRPHLSAASITRLPSSTRGEPVSRSGS